MASKYIQTCKPWSFDIWSLGIIVVEIISGFPVWLHGKYEQININGESRIGNGVLAVEGRDFHRIKDI
jgi:hypothetical protein